MKYECVLRVGKYSLGKNAGGFHKMFCDDKSIGYPASEGRFQFYEWHGHKQPENDPEWDSFAEKVLAYTENK